MTTSRSAKGEDNNGSFSRRTFLKFLTWAAGLISILKLAPRLAWSIPNTAKTATNFPALPEIPNDRIRMQREVQNFLQKPEKDRDWIMVIDLKKCVGCHSCTVACVAENHLPPGVVYLPVFEEERGVYPQVSRNFLPRPCMQCNVPPCVPVCPTNATYKSDDGTVPVNYDRCIGCRACITACPYGARTFDFGENHTKGMNQSLQPYETSPSPEYGENRLRNKGQPPIGTVRKCHFCTHRLREGMLPACAATCIGGAIYFGPGPNADPDSLVSRLVDNPRVMRLKEELGTQPRVYYLRPEETS